MTCHHASDEQFDELMRELRKKDEWRAGQLPDEKTALRVMFECHQRLKELGWNDAIYCPKDGTAFEAIEPGSTGVFRCYYTGEWPNGHWWLEDGGDVYPARPVLFRLYPEDAAKEKARWAAARKALGESLTPPQAGGDGTHPMSVSGEDAK